MSKVVRNCPSFLIKRKPNNLKACNSFRHNGLIHCKTVGVEPAADCRGVVVVMNGSLPPPMCGLSSTRMLAPHSAASDT
uniref:60S ribosomal protein L28 n=1 Tax=Cercocebus atys TaxID=9531 RepID=A0A2K5M2F3_CERAT